MIILHRARELITGTWFFGFYTGCQFFIIENEGGIVEIDESTVGVFTGRLCKNTNERLFTGDIVLNQHNENRYIVFDDFNCSFLLRSSFIYCGNSKLDNGVIKIGNIFENKNIFKEPEDKGYIDTPETTTSTKWKANISRQISKQMRLK